MSQAYTGTFTGMAAATIIETKLPGSLDALLTLHAGASPPPNPVAYMLWMDTGTGLLKMRNAANSAWVVAFLTPWMIELGGLSASRNVYLGTFYRTGYVLGCRLLSDTATVGSGAGVKWDFQIRNKTAAVNLLAAAATTNGNEVAVDTPWNIYADQNQQPAANAALELQITKTGAATNLVRASVEVLTILAPV